MAPRPSSVGVVNQTSTWSCGTRGPGLSGIVVAKRKKDGMELIGNMSYSLWRLIPVAKAERETELPHCHERTESRLDQHCFLFPEGFSHPYLRPSQCVQAVWSTFGQEPVATVPIGRHSIKTCDCVASDLRGQWSALQEWLHKLFAAEKGCATCSQAHRCSEAMSNRKMMLFSCTCRTWGLPSSRR